MEPNQNQQTSENVRADERMTQTELNTSALEQQPVSRRLNRRAIILTILLFALLIAGMFAFAYMQQSEGDAAPDAGDDEPDRYENITRIDAKHFYIDGVHTVAGEIAMPTPCDLLESEARVAESYPEQISLEFTVVNNAEFCPETITPQRFKVSATASEEATFTARFEGRRVELNLVEAAPGETPEEFELFIKG